MNVTTFNPTIGLAHRAGPSAPTKHKESVEQRTIGDRFEPSTIDAQKQPGKLLSNLKMAGLYAAGAAALAATPLAGEGAAIGAALLGGMVLMDSLTGLFSVRSKAAQAAAAIVGSLSSPVFVAAAAIPVLAAATHGVVGAGLAVGAAALLGAARDTIQTTFDWPVKG